MRSDVYGQFPFSVIFSVICDRSPAAFTIHNTTGVVTLSHTIDRETAALHGMTVSATDNGHTRLSTTIPLRITVWQLRH